MGKKKGKHKSKSSSTPSKPKDERTLPFLQEMFSNVDKEVVSMVFMENDYDEEKTMQQLEELADGSKPTPSLYDEGDLLDGIESVDLEEPLSKSNFASKIPNTTNNAGKRQAPPKLAPFISTFDEYDTTSHKTWSSNSNSTLPLSFSAPSSSRTSTSSNSSHTSIPFTSTSTSSSSTPPSTLRTSAKFANSELSYEGGDSKQFLASMFPELDSTMVALLFEENGNDVGKTTESLLSIVFMNHNSTAAEADQEDEEEYEDTSESTEFTFSEETENTVDSVDTTDTADAVNDTYEGSDEFSDDGDTETRVEEFMSTLSPQTTHNENANSAVKSDFIVKLNILAEMFPDTPRTLLALELDEFDCDLQKTILSCCRADPEYLRRISGEKPLNVTPAKEDKPKEERPKGPSAVDSILKPSWVGSGSSHAHLLNSASKVKYVKPTPTETETTTSSAAKRRNKNKRREKAAPQATASPRRRGMDLAAKLKLKQLREKFSFVEPEILESVFAQSGHKVQATLLCLYDIYPHLRENTAAPENASYVSGINVSPPGSPEKPLNRKREKPDTATPTTPTQAQQPIGDKPRKTKRTKPEKEGEDGEGAFITVSYRKKKPEPAEGAPKKKFMDSEDIENAYQNYREQAIKNQEMRNLLFMQAAAAYSAGDGARAKALSQRAREYEAMMRDSQTQAFHQIFLDCNARFDTLAQVDLHGLHVAEALHVLKELLAIHAQMGENNNKTKSLRIITGQGIHSVRGIARIRPAVKNCLKSLGYAYVEEPGVITVSLSSV